MKQEELRKKMRNLEKTARGIFEIHSSNMDVKQSWLPYGLNDKAAETQLEKLKEFQNNPVGLTSTVIDEKTIYYDEQIAVYRKFSRIFMDLANVKKEEFYNKLKLGEKEGTIFRIANIAQNILKETMDTAYSWLQQFGVTDVSREAFQSRYAKKMKKDHETLMAFFLKRIERGLLECYKKNQDAVILDCGKGRMELYDPMEQSITSVVYDLGGFKNSSDYIKLLDDVLSKTKLVDDYANFVFMQIVKIGKYVTEVLVEYQKMPLLFHDYDVQLIYEVYLYKFLYGKISANDFSDILWTILGESLDNEMVLSGILNFEETYDKGRSKELCKWDGIQGYYMQHSWDTSVFYYIGLQDKDFIKNYNKAIYYAQNEIETQYYMERYRSWYLNKSREEEKKVVKNKIKEREYVCKRYHIREGAAIKKLNETENRACESFKKISELKSRVDNYLKGQKWSEAIELIDGRCGYVELAIFWAFEEQIKYKYKCKTENKIWTNDQTPRTLNLVEAMEEQRKIDEEYEKRFGSQLGYIRLLLSNAQNLLSEIDRAIGEMLGYIQEQGVPGPLKTMALNVFRAACHYYFIQTEHHIMNMTNSQIESKNISEFKQWRMEYKKKREQANYQMMKQCEMIIMQGVNKGVALSCVLLLKSYIPNNMDEHQKKMMHQVAVQKQCPEQMLEKGAFYLADGAKASEALEAYYWYLMAWYMSEKKQDIGVIRKIQYIVFNEHY